MAATVCVSTSGPVLSFLLYENVNSATNQEGFLLGEVVNKETNTISDSQINGKETATSISLHSILPLPSKFSFYNNVGKVNGKKLKDIVKGKSKEIIGWFRYRRNAALTPHLIDRVIHQQLAEIISVENRDSFIMCILSSSKSVNGSTHRFNHVFYTNKYSEFEAIPLNIENLGDTSISGYKIVSNTSCSSESFQNIISSLKLDQENFSEAQLVLNMQILVKKQLQKLVHDLSQSETRVSDLQKEVDLLKAQLKSGKVSNELLLPQLLSLPVESEPDSKCSESDATPMNKHQTLQVRTEMDDESEINEKMNGKEVEIISSDVCLQEEVKEQEPPQSPPLTKAAGDPFDFVTELKLKMTPAGGRRNASPVPEGFSSPKGSSVSGVTGSKRKQPARNPSSPSPGSASSAGETTSNKSSASRHQRSSPQRSVRKVSTQENQRQSKSRQNSAGRSSATTANSSHEN